MAQQLKAAAMLEHQSCVVSMQIVLLSQRQAQSHYLFEHVSSRLSLFVLLTVAVAFEPELDSLVGAAV